VENMDPRDDRTSAIRGEMKRLLLANMRPAVQAVQPRPAQRLTPDSPPVLPAMGNVVVGDDHNKQSSLPRDHEASSPKYTSSGLQLPPLDLGNNAPFSAPSRTGPLTPITERTLSAELPAVSSLQDTPSPSPLNDRPQRQGSTPGSILPKDHSHLDVSTAEPISILSGPITHSPQISSLPPSNVNASTSPSRPSQHPPGSRPTSALDRPISRNNVADKNPTSPTSPKLQDNHVSDVPAYSPVVSSPNLSSSGPQLSPKSHLNQTFPVSYLNERSSTNLSSRSAGESTSPEPNSDIDQNRSNNGNAMSGQIHSFKAQPSHTARSTPTEEPNDFMAEAGALYYMRQNDTVNKGATSGQVALDGEDSTSSYNESDAPQSRAVANPPPQTSENLGHITAPSDNRLIPSRRGTPMAFVDKTSNSSPSTSATVGRRSPSRSSLGRKPSGARAQSSTTRSFDHRGAGSISSQTVTEEDEHMAHNKENDALDLVYDDHNGEALAALTYLDIADQETAPSTSSPRQPIQTVEPLKIRSDRNTTSSPLPTSSGESGPYRSSFAPSNKAAERKLKTQAQQAAHHAATHKPGRVNGKKKSNTAGAWESSDEEEEEEEEEEDDDDEVQSDSERPTGRGYHTNSSQQGLSTTGSLRPLQTQQSQEYQQDGVQTPSHLRPPRNLPEIPGNRGIGEHLKIV